MAKVYAFPVKRKLSVVMEEDLRKVAKDYVAVLAAISSVLELEENPPTTDEVIEMVADAFGKGIIDAIDDMTEL